MNPFADEALRWQSMQSFSRKSRAVKTIKTVTLPRFAYLLVATALLAACATSPATAPQAPAPAAPEQNIRAQTEDLAMPVDEALQLAGRYGAGRVLVAFDIDNTLLAMEQGLGSDQWYYWQKDLAAKDPCSELLAGDLLQTEGALFHESAMIPTQPDAAAQVRRAQDAGLTVIAVTSRGPVYRLTTFRELRRNGIAFWPSALPPQRGFPGEYVPEGAERSVRYEDGVHMTAGQHKGHMLAALLAKSGTESPAVIVFVDDKQKYVDQVMEAFADSGTAVHGWRYAREDARVRAFDPEEAATQWKALQPALTTIEEIFGPDNFHLDPPSRPEDCNR